MPTRDKFLRRRVSRNRRQQTTGDSSAGEIIQRYGTIKYPTISLSARDIYITTSSVDRLDTLANQFYRDVDLWWIIATANPDVIRRDSLCVEAGIQIRIPLDINTVLDDFERLNNK